MIKFRDFEDCLQDRCAEKIGAKYIITRNVKDFEGSAAPAILPEKFLVTISKWIYPIMTAMGKNECDIQISGSNNEKHIEKA